MPRCRNIRARMHQPHAVSVTRSRSKPHELNALAPNMLAATAESAGAAYVATITGPRPRAQLGFNRETASRLGNHIRRRESIRPCNDAYGTPGLRRCSRQLNQVPRHPRGQAAVSANAADLGELFSSVPAPRPTAAAGGGLAPGATLVEAGPVRIRYPVGPSGTATAAAVSPRRGLRAVHASFSRFRPSARTPRRSARASSRRLRAMTINHPGTVSRGDAFLHLRRTPSARRPSAVERVRTSSGCRAASTDGSKGAAAAFHLVVERVVAHPAAVVHRGIAAACLRELPPPSHDPVDAASAVVGSLFFFLILTAPLGVIALIGLVLRSARQRTRLMMIDFAPGGGAPGAQTAEANPARPPAALPSDNVTTMRHCAAATARAWYWHGSGTCCARSGSRLSVVSSSARLCTLYTTPVIYLGSIGSRMTGRHAHEASPSRSSGVRSRPCCGWSSPLPESRVPGSAGLAAPAGRFSDDAVIASLPGGQSETMHRLWRRARARVGRSPRCRR